MDMSLSKLQEIVRQEGLACYSPWGRKEVDTTEWPNNNNLRWWEVPLLECGIHILTSFARENIWKEQLYHGETTLRVRWLAFTSTPCWEYLLSIWFGNNGTLLLCSSSSTSITSVSSWENKKSTFNWGFSIKYSTNVPQNYQGHQKHESLLKA